MQDKTDSGQMKEKGSKVAPDGGKITYFRAAKQN